ncbi:AfsR/SARP family transcriptional regulator [Nocardiopsis deserti]|uniref:AfsR/SARP family transcriptional regulator n=1 Tax=Nocardiopsis deserti TaxID=2605988 RepID=UPI00123BFE1F|nr:BTAD domain-containing putative transcriptional regulator [Nocardiopsis deserti]
MRVAILGPLRVVADGRSADVGGPRLRALLARLALDAGRPVGHRPLAEDLWPEAGDAVGPENPRAALHSLVSRLRRALPDPRALRSEPAGYRLDLPADAVDAVLFARLARRGRDALRAGRHGEAAEHLDRALELWRGDPLADIAPLPYAEAAAVRLAELRLGAVEDRAEAGLALPGRAPSAAELEALAAEHPLRERLRTLLVAVLDAEGRRAEALSAYASYRTRLAEELGTDPGPRLRALHLRILREEGGPAPALPTPAPAPQKSVPSDPGAAQPSPVPAQPQGCAQPDPATTSASASAPEPVSAPHGNLRTPLNAFVGREGELRLVGERLAEHRLVTLVGPGGVGKTRLASVAAADTGGRVWLVELGPVGGPDDVPQAVAGALGLRVLADPLARLVEALSVTDTLLVLDCCEHVVDAAARLAEELLGRCPRLRVLATSREPLGVAGEALCPVPPLAPEAARRLFTDRARAARPDFSPTGEVDRICARLDGLPLAIELAAARLRSMSVEALAAGLDDRFRILGVGSRTAPARHRTLRGVVAWSWDLLTPAERDAAERLSVFRTLTTAAAERVGVAAETLYSLVDRSLLETDGDRYRMLDTIREYGRERLAATGRLDDARSAHTACFLDLAERAEPRLRGPKQTEWLARLADDHDNLLAALGHARDSGDAGTAVRLGSALGLFWAVRGDHANAVVQLGAVLRGSAPEAREREPEQDHRLHGAVPKTRERDRGPERDARLRASAAYLLNAVFTGELTGAGEVVGPPPGTAGPVSAFVTALLALAEGRTADGTAALEPHLAHPDPWTRAMLWLARSFLGGASGDTARGREDVEQAMSAFREAGERWGLSLLLMSLAYSRAATGDTGGATAVLEEALALTRELGDQHGQRVWLAMAYVDTGNTDRARARLEEVVAEAASTRQVALARVCLADLARHEGDPARAGRLLDLARGALGDGEPPDRALYRAAAGHLAAVTGDLGAAVRHLVGAFVLADTLPDLPMLAQVAVATADLFLRGDEPARAARVLGAAHALRGGPNPYHPDVARLTRDLRAHRADYDRASRLTPEEALAAFRVELDGLAARGPRPPPGAR